MRQHPEILDVIIDIADSGVEDHVPIQRVLMQARIARIYMGFEGEWK
jgi:hypothetical protein